MRKYHQTKTLRGGASAGLGNSCAAVDEHVKHAGAWLYKFTAFEFSVVTASTWP